MASGKAMWLSMTAFRTGADDVCGNTLSDHRPTSLRRRSVRQQSGAARRSGHRVARPSPTAATAPSPTRSTASRRPSRSLGSCSARCRPARSRGQSNLALATNYQGNWWSAGAGESGWGRVFHAPGRKSLRELVHLRQRRHAAMAVGDGRHDRPTAPYSGTLYRTDRPCASTRCRSTRKRVGRTPVGSLDADLRQRQQREVRLHGHDR